MSRPRNPRAAVSPRIGRNRRSKALCGALEQLESRQLFALVGMDALLNAATTQFVIDNPGSITYSAGYSASAGDFGSTSTVTRVRQVAPYPSYFVNPPPTSVDPNIALVPNGVQLNFLINKIDGTIAGHNPSGDDLDVYGKLSVGGVFYDGSATPLLRGTVTEFGFADDGTKFDFRFTITGGLLASSAAFDGMDIGISFSDTQKPTPSPLPARFDTDFTGLAKGILAPVPATHGGPPSPVVLSGTKFQDLTGDGFSSDDTALAGVTINLFKDVDNDGLLTAADGAPIASQVTGANGSYLFDSLPAGATYFVQEAADPSYVQTGGLTYYTANPTAGQAVTNLNFDNFKKITISGTKFQDLTGNSFSADDAPLAGITINLYNASDLSTPINHTVTDSTGAYSFPNLGPGTYFVQEVLPAGYTQTGGNAGYTIAATSGLVAANNNFDNYALQPTIDIEKYVNPAPTPLGGEGLTPGFWKQSQHFYAWTNYHTTDSYNAVFGVNDPAGSSLSLLDALARGGGGNAALGRHAVAALLNAANPNVSYLYSAGQIISLVQNAYATGNYDYAKNLLAQQNELEADLSTPALFTPSAPAPGYDADLPGSGPTVLAGTQLTFTLVVTNPGQTPLMNVVVTDDNATPSNTADDFHPAYVSGDTNHDSILDLNETWIYTYVTAALAGSHTNTATVTGTNVFNSAQQVTDADAANYSTGSDTQPPPPPAPASISGIVYWDKDNDGTIDSNESGIAGVTVLLTGTDDDGNAVSLTDTTAADGSYSFENLRPGTYSVHETQPAGYNDGIDSLGSLGGSAANDLFSSITIDAGDSGVNYNFGELKSTPPSTTPTLSTGMTATIGFWQNKNGQALIKSMNGGPSSTNLGNWFATHFPNLFGPDAGDNNLTGKTNTLVANRFTTLFKQKGMKLQAQVMAVGFAIYVTDTSLAGGNYAASYGFVTSSTGTGAATYNVGAAGDSLGLNDNQTYTVLQIIQAANSSHLFSTSTSTQTAANSIFDGINNTGDIT